MQERLSKRDDNKFMQHTLAWCDGKDTKLVIEKYTNQH